MTVPAGAVVAAAAALAVTVALCLVLPGALRRAQLIDAPGDRSSHTHPTPRGGGIAVLAGVLTAAVLALVLGGAPGGADADLGGDWLAALAGVGVAAGLIGLVDDARGLPPAVRAVLQLVVGAGAGLLVVALDDVSWVWVPVAAVALAAYVNAVNFMDGLNTLTASHAVVVGVGYAVMGALAADRGPADTVWLVAAGLVVAAGGLGFLPFNGVSGGPARLFLGDVGSYGLGAMVAFMAGAGFLTGLPLEMALAPLVVWLADTAHTLVLRVAAGERWYLPHRTHAYQRLTDAGWTHRQVSLAASAATVLAMVVATAVAEEALMWRLVGAVLLVLVGWAWVKLPGRLGHPSPWGAVARARRHRDA